MTEGTRRRVIDLNCDLGESFGAYQIGADAAVMPYITSANVACGYHAGDALVMDRTVRLAVEHGVGIGVHPGYPDLLGFGRRPMQATPAEVEAYVLHQIGALYAFARAHGAELAHVKAHGALYNVAAVDRATAEGIARGIRRFSRDLIMVGLAGTVMLEVGQELGLRVASEAFADRAYTPDGQLQSRQVAGSLLRDPQQIARRAVELARGDGVVAVDGGRLAVHADTICLHGDTPEAGRLGRAIREALAAAGIDVAPMATFLR